MGKTIHVYQDEGGWVVKREGKTASVHATRQEAVDSALAIVRSLEAAQMVVHGKDGRITERVEHGLPKIEPHPRKSGLGSKAISQAVGKVVLDRLRSERRTPA